MSQELARLFMALVATVLVARLAIRAEPGTRRRQSFTLATIGFALLALGNALPVLAISSPVLLTLAAGIGLAMLLGSLVSLFLAYREGELTERFRRAGAIVAEERKKLADRERRANDRE